jgi:hypothetical protein
MRATIAIALCLLAAEFSAAELSATEQFSPPPSCAAYPPAAPNCACGNPYGCPNCNPNCRPPCSPPGPPKEGPPKEGPPELPNQPVETGVYLAPPRSGVTRGPVTYRGVEGASITFPELKLKFPSIRLPSCFHDHSGARMTIDSAVAPWESHGYANAYAAQNETALRQQVQQLQDRGASSGDDRAAREAAENHLKSTQDELERLRCEVNRLRQLDDCIRQYQRDLEQNPNCQQSSRGAGNAPPTNSPGGYYQPARPAPPPDYGARRSLPAAPQVANDLDARLRQLEQAESRIDQKLAALQEASLRAQASLPVSFPREQSAPRFAPAAQSAQPLPIQPQYVSPPFVERPVSYISEPRPLYEPRRLPISEPPSPVAHITGIRGSR